MVFDLEMIKKLYELYPQKVEAARTLLQKPLTLSEKILYTHLWDGEAKEVYERGASYVDFAPDRVAMQDATAQMALLQFMQAGKQKAAVPSTVHADHLIQARIGADKDLQEAINKNNEVYNFLSSVFIREPYFFPNLICIVPTCRPRRAFSPLSKLSRNCSNLSMRVLRMHSKKSLE